MRCSVLALGLVLMMTACGGTGKVSIGADEQIAAYKTSPEVMSTNGIEVTAKLTAFGPDAMLRLEVKIKNNSQNKISINPAIAAIQGDSVFNTPYSFEGGETGLAPGAESSFVSIYKPINNPFLMSKYNIRGDLKKSFSLELSFIGDQAEQPLLSSRINFEIPEQAYADYIAKLGIEKDFHGYELFINPDVFVSAQKKYMQDNNMHVVHEHDAHEGHDEHEEHEEGEVPDFIKDISVLVSGNEILVDNIMMKMVGYKIKDTLTVFFRIINRKPEKLSIDIKKFMLKVDGKEYSPVNDFIKDNPGVPNKEGVIPLELNERIECIFEYKLDSTPKLIEWGTDGFMNKDGIKMFYTNFIFSNVGMN